MSLHVPLYKRPTRSSLDPNILGQLDRLAEASGQDLVGQLAAMFVVDADAQLIEMRRALDHADAAAVARSAHNMKGASSTLGAIGLASLCATLESETAEGILANAESLLEAIGLEIGLVDGAFAERSAARSPGGEELAMAETA